MLYTFQTQKRPSYGDVARSWDDILHSFERRASKNSGFLPLLHLTQKIMVSPYPAAGLYGLTSMNDILLGRSADVTANPYLRISYNFERRFTFTYWDFTREPWTRECAVEEAWSTLERFLLKRARWFTKLSIHTSL